jgi:hypothetical protein
LRLRLQSLSSRLALVRAAFRYLTSVLFLAIVVQVGLASYGAFDAIHKAKHASVTKKTIEHGFDAHAALGTIIVILLLLTFVVAAAARMGRAWVPWIGGLFVAGVVQMVLGTASANVPWLGFFHGIVALAMYAGVALLAHRAWTQTRTA